MNSKQQERLKLLAGELAQVIKTGEDLSALTTQLVKLTVEAALSAELENHLGYPPHSPLGQPQRKFPQRQFAEDIERHARRSFD